MENLSKPVQKTLTVMEYMAAHPHETSSLEHLSQQCDIPKATLLRILNTFVHYGYISKTASKRYLCNFAFSKAIPLDAEHLTLLEDVLKSLVKECRQSVEILTVNGKQVYWYDKLEDPELQVRIAAQIGFKRTLYELDALSRIYLKFLGVKWVERQFDVSSFYTASNEYRELSWEDARYLIESANAEGVEYDVLGNRNGIRRFVTVISSPTGEFLYLLTIAEPALLINNTDEHIQKHISLLRKYKQELLHSTQ